MRAVVVGSRDLVVEDLRPYLPEGVTEIVSNGEDGIGACARAHAKAYNVLFKEFVPEYDLYAKGAPFERDTDMIEYADVVIALWDGESPGTAFFIRECRKRGKPLTVHHVSN